MLNNLSNYARAICRNDEDAKDLVQDTIINAYNNFDKLRDEKSFLSFLFTIASRLHRKNQKRAFFIRKNKDTILGYIQTQNDNNNKHDINVLYKLLSKLPDKQKEAIILFEINGFSINEIRKIQGGTISGVKSRLRRARERLKALLANDINIIENRIEEITTMNENINY
jgi:RNA polymerase sigma-70 factor (ECF subfamily)